MERSPILKEMIENVEIGIVGGTDDIKTGLAQFLYRNNDSKFAMGK